MQEVFLVAIAIGCVVAISDWRKGLLVAIVLDCVRDPVRKLTPDEPTVLTYIVCLVWGSAFLNLFLSGDRGLQFVRWRFPWLEKACTIFLIGLIPGAIISIASYQNGFVLAGLGGASYGAPLLGIALGVALAATPQYFEKLLKLYVIVNSVALVGSVAEWADWGWPAMGGLEGFEWIRHMPGVIVRLISGFFRSPDIAGFHAANAMMVSAMLLLPRTASTYGIRRINPGWVVTLIWCAVPLILCGRRKMLIMPIVFLVAYLLYMQIMAKRKMGHIVAYMLVIGFLVVGALSFWRDEDSLQDHQAYLATTVTDAVPRAQENIGGGVIVTLRQSGVLGSGLGVATQGAQHFAVDAAARKGVWQEDGVSRLFKELGLPGVILFGVAFASVLKNCRIAIRYQKSAVLEETQGMSFAIVAANLSSFVVSHQHFSGDPANALWVLMFTGIFIGSLSLGITNSRPSNKLG